MINTIITRHQESFTKTFFQNITLSIKQEYKLMQVYKSSNLTLQKTKDKIFVINLIE